MKSKNSIIGWAYLLSLIVILLFLGNFLALHDIKQDYVNNTVMESLQQDSSRDIADWASCKMEWGFIQISLILQSVFMIIIFIALAKATKKLKL